ncbi:MAG: phosphoribosylformylglycinamidine synthase [Myxococcales bacterium]|nr:phosphoribosylformylglycinamidine synthase [Myxococcales bacterium]
MTPRPRVTLCASEAHDAFARAVAAWLSACDCGWRTPGDALDGDVALVTSDVSEPSGRSELEQALGVFARAGGAVLGVGAGAAFLCAAGLLPGAVTTTPPGETTHLRVEGRATPFTWAIPAGRILPRPDVPSAFSYVATAEVLSAIVARGGILVRHCDVAGGVRGDASSVAGWCDESGRIVGLVGALALDVAALGSAFARQLAGCVESARPRV